jgi:hypothetical protein
MDYWICVFLPLIHLTSLAASFPTTTASTNGAKHFKRFIIDSSACTSCNDFIGFVYEGGSWVALDCNPGDFFTFLDPTYGGCIASTASDSPQSSSAYCESTSLIVALGTIAATCGTAQSFCMTILMYPNLDLGIATTLIACDNSFGTVTYFRATTRGAASVAATTTSISASQSQSNKATQQSSLYGGLTASSTQSPSSSSTTPSSSTQSSSSNSNSSHKSNAIGLGTGIGLGVPAVLIATAALLLPRYRRAHREKEDEVVKTSAESPRHPDLPGALAQTTNPETNLYNTPIPPGRHGNPAEMEQTNIMRSELDGN